VVSGASLPTLYEVLSNGPEQFSDALSALAVRRARFAVTCLARSSRQPIAHAVVVNDGGGRSPLDRRVRFVVIRDSAQTASHASAWSRPVGFGPPASEEGSVLPQIRLGRSDMPPP
jgi:hypothetical protein